MGRINVYNLLAAIAAAQALGLPNEVIESGIANLENVSGRFQRIDQGQPFLVVVDYAHTDDALENLIQTARELNPKGRIITLFGCGGLKDRTKRPATSPITGRLSNLTILSSDNPRSEDRTLEFDDRDVARRALRERGFAGPPAQTARGAGGHGQGFGT